MATHPPDSGRESRYFNDLIVLASRKHGIAPLIQPPGVDFGRCQGGDDKARVGLALSPFSLADDAANAAPTVQGGSAEVLEAAGGLSGLLRFRPRGRPPRPGLCRPARDSRQAQD